MTAAPLKQQSTGEARLWKTSSEFNCSFPTILGAMRSIAPTEQFIGKIQKPATRP